MLRGTAVSCARNLAARRVRSGPFSARAHGHGHMASGAKESKGFVDEMRMVAMKLHTREQAPKEGQAEEPAKPMTQWQPTDVGYLRFLVESKAVYDCMEEIVQSNDPVYAKFKQTGLERSAALAKDIEWFRGNGLEVPEASGTGLEYAAYLKEVAERSPPAFICHFYNVYFAHTAGGRMIGNKISEMILDGAVLEFYKWDGDLKEMLTRVKDDLNSVAEKWSADEKKACLEETSLSFKYSGQILREIYSEVTA
mmetsp:Transcript_8254/g.27450  ORF Transcript_8254/g.27450 Transcript_8254/m.27450 type:complete len:253 (+) Transcript_8254:35-793(+)